MSDVHADDGNGNSGSLVKDLKSHPYLAGSHLTGRPKVLRDEGSYFSCAPQMG